MTKNQKFFLSIMFFLIFMFFIYIFINPTGNQLDLFFRHFYDYMADFFNPIRYVMENNPYFHTINGPAEHCYPPLAYFLFVIFKRLSTFGLTQNINELLFVCHFSMFLFCFAFLLTVYNGFKTSGIFKNLFIFTLIFSGLFLSSFERGNIIFLTSACIAFFIYYHSDDNKLLRELSIILLAIATTLKCSPGLFAIVFLYNKNYKSLLKFIIYSTLLFIIPFLFFKGGLTNILAFIHNLSFYSGSYMYRGIPAFELFGNYKIYARMLYSNIAIATSVLALISNFTLKSYWKKFAQLALITFSITNVTGFYALTYFIPAIVLFFNQQETDKYDIVYIILFILILNPLQLTFLNINITNDISLSAELIILILLTIESWHNVFVKLENKITLQNNK